MTQDKRSRSTGGQQAPSYPAMQSPTRQSSYGDGAQRVGERRRLRMVGYVCPILIGLALGANSVARPESPASDGPPVSPGGPIWQEDFDLTRRALLATGRNRYFVLEPGFQLALEGRNERVVITVLDDTVNVEGVTTRVVEEREWQDGQLIEVSRNFFALCRDTEDVFYFGEDVDIYRDGEMASHEGAWRAGENGARAGLMMPGEPTVGNKYYQEIAPGVAMDRAEVVSLSDTLETPVGVFFQCLKTREGTALDPAEQEFKVYAPGIGLVQDADLLLTAYGFVPE